MNKLALAAAISSLTWVPAASATPSDYYSWASSGTPDDPLAGFSVAAPATSIWYVDPNWGSASNIATPAIQKYAESNWTFDFSDPAAVRFTGYLRLEAYRIQIAVSRPAIDARQTFGGTTTQAFSGVGTYDATTRTFSYSFMNPTVNDGGASTYSSTGFATCVNGATSVLGKVCSNFYSISPSWEGLALHVVFTEDRSGFFGTLQGTDTFGSGLSRNTVTMNWMIESAQVPVPASAWLFGSALVGLARTRRLRMKP